MRVQSAYYAIVWLEQHLEFVEGARILYQNLKNSQDHNTAILLAWYHFLKSEDAATLELTYEDFRVLVDAVILNHYSVPS